MQYITVSVGLTVILQLLLHPSYKVTASYHSCKEYAIWNKKIQTLSQKIYTAKGQVIKYLIIWQC